MKPTSEILERIAKSSKEHKDGVFTRLYRYLLREIFIMPPIKNSMQTEVQQQKVLMMIPQTDSANYILRN